MVRMEVISNTVVIGCGIDETFDYLSDHRNEKEWNPAIESIEKITDGPVRLGTKFRAKWKKSPLVEMEVVEYDRPHRWATHNGGPIEATVRFRLEPVEGGTQLLADFEATPHGWFKLVFPLFIARMRKDEKANMTYLKSALEGRASR
jgi:Polyketide cyclase / dehydrase and lipid transport